MASLFDNSGSFTSGIPLSQYTAAISNAVATSPGLAGVWVIAELSDVRMSGGHCYMELIEKNSSGQTIAKLKANIWRNNYINLRHKFFGATQREITTGIKALVRGTATHHPLYGLSFNIYDIDPSYTVGDMERLRREILLRLHKEGVAMFNKSLPLPPAPQRIAVISAEGAAGYGDFMNQLTRNSEGFVFYPCLFPSVMQGDKVSESIRNALLLIESTAEMWDCVAIVRGGGATTDLNGFDDYELAKAVATCGLPVVVGIGHDRDKNVLDELAHTSVKTPTAVAAFFIDRLREAYDRIVGTADRIRIYSTEMLRGEERRLSTIQGVIPQLALRRINDAKAKLHLISGKLPILTQSRITQENLKIESWKNSIGNFGASRIGKEHLRIESYINLLKNISVTGFRKESQRIENIESMIRVLDPQNTLKRGYSITRINGKAVKNREEVRKGDKLITTLQNGEIESIVG